MVAWNVRLPSVPTIMRRVNRIEARDGSAAATFSGMTPHLKRARNRASGGHTFVMVSLLVTRRTEWLKQCAQRRYEMAQPMPWHSKMRLAPNSLWNFAETRKLQRNFAQALTVRRPPQRKPAAQADSNRNNR